MSVLIHEEFRGMPENRDVGPPKVEPGTKDPIGGTLGRGTCKVDPGMENKKL